MAQLLAKMAQSRMVMRARGVDEVVIVQVWDVKEEKRLYKFGVAQVQLREKMQPLSDSGAMEENSEAPLRSAKDSEWPFLGVCAGVTFPVY
jgi:hypothetical protein